MRRFARIDPEEFWRVWQKLLREIDDGAAIIVEGKHDYEVLRELFIDGKIYVCSQLGFANTADIAASEGVRRVVILTDFDKKGEEEAWKLAFFLRNVGIEVLDGLRREIKKVLRGVECIEDLRFYVDFLKEKSPFEIYVRSERGLFFMKSQ
ncbi:MAG: toprim domain-containing protein [Candidatus Njordarchaeales archaeon]